MCPATGLGLMNVTFTETYARSVDLMLERAGPTSLLPAAENQVVVFDYTGQKEYGLWVDATSSRSAPRVINCTIFPFKNTVTPEQFKASLMGSLGTKGQPEGSVPCGYAGKTCEVWGYVNTFSIGCEGKAYEGHEPLVGTFEPRPMGVAADAASSSFIFRSVTNDIYMNSSLPKACAEAEGSTRWYHTTYLQDWAPSPSADVFKVPPDSQCAKGEAREGSRAHGASSWLAGLRGALPFH